MVTIPEINLTYASAKKTDQVVAVDNVSLSVISSIPTGYYPDGMDYSPETSKLYVSNEFGRSISVIDTKTQSLIKNIFVGGNVGNTIYDPISKHVFSNDQSNNELIEIDPLNDRIISRTFLKNAKGNHGLSINSKYRLAFIACEDNNKLLVLDLNDKHVINTFEVSPQPDVIATDETLNLLYIASESGGLSVFSVENGKIFKIKDIFIHKKAHTIAVDQSTHELFFPIESYNGKPTLMVYKPKF